MRRWSFAVALLAGSLAPAQDLPPEVLLLSRIKAHMADKIQRLPDYTCLETVRRFHAEPKTRGVMKPFDTVLLEILYSRHQDSYAAPGERQFRAADVASLAATGMMGSGIFTLQLEDILLGHASVLTYKGEEDFGGRMAVRYDFRLSRLQSGFRVSVVGGQGTVGVQGSVWADPQSLEILHTEARADDIPPFLPVSAVTWTVSFAPVKIGQKEELLPQSAELYMRQTFGEESRDFFEFTHCRSFHAESSIHFDSDVVRPAKADVAPSSPPPTDVEQTVPALLLVTVTVVTPITEKDAVGAPIEGRVSADVRHKGKVIVPAGSLIRGRIRRLEQSVDVDGYFVVGLEFTEIVANGVPMRFYADLLKLNRVKGVQEEIERSLHSNTGAGEILATQKVTLGDLPGIASFFVRGKTFTLPPELQLVWRTRGILR